CVCPFPGALIWLSREDLHILWASRKRIHRHRFTHPDTSLLQSLLPCAHLRGIIFCGLDEIGLHPRNSLTRIDQKVRDPFGSNAAVLVQFVAALFCDGLYAALE